MFKWISKIKNWRRIKAVEELNAQVITDENGKIKIDRIEYDSWIRYTSEIIKKYVGETSRFYTFFDGFKIIQIPIQNTPSKEELALEQHRAMEASVNLIDCMIYISNGGELVQKQDWFCSWPMGAKVTTIIFLGTLIFSAGRWIDSISSKDADEIKQLKVTYQKTLHEKDSIKSLLDTCSTHNKPATIPDTGR